MLSFYMSMLETKEEKTKFHYVYEDNYEALRNLAMSILHDRYRAEDLVHEAFVKLIRKKTKLMTGSEIEIKAFLVVVLKNLMADDWRRRNKIKFTPLDDDAMPKREFIAHQPEDGIITVLDVAQGLEELHALNPMYVQILVLRYVNELDIKSIAQTFNISQGATKMRLQRARAAWDTVIKEDDHESN